jgi:uncharacterized protein (DUF885 family)
MRRIAHALAPLLLACSLGAQDAPPGPAAEITALADDYVAAFLERNPEYGTMLGLPMARHDLAMDPSPAALRAWEATVDGFLERLGQAEPAELAGRPEWVTYGFLRDALESEVGRRVCRNELWSVNQLVGAHVLLPVLAARQPVGTDELRAAALARFVRYGPLFDQEVDYLREGLRLGYSAPRGNVERVVAQLDGLLALTAEDSPFYEPATRDPSPTFHARWAALITDTLYPALTRYRDFLRDEYLAAARTATAVSALPDGAACYRALARSATSLDLTPERIHESGLQAMERIHVEMMEIGARSFGTTDVAELMERLRSDPAYLYGSADEILAVTESAIARARRAAPGYFGRLPTADVVVTPFPDFQAASSPGGMYIPATEDASQPGIYYINLYKPELRPRAMTETIAFHEAIPGHHFQIALAMERPQAHPITRFFGATAFAEGWGLYAERLADEMGLYSSDLARLGMLSSLAFRAARVVVDPGLHVLGWTRQQAIDYTRANTANDLADIETEVDRYIIWPGQATAYMTGYNEIMALRAAAETALGEWFDLPAFHDEVLGDGAVTLPMLREKVERWIAGRLAGR